MTDKVKDENPLDEWGRSNPHRAGLTARNARQRTGTPS